MSVAPVPVKAMVPVEGVKVAPEVMKNGRFAPAPDPVSVRVFEPPKLKLDPDTQIDMMVILADVAKVRVAAALLATTSPRSCLEAVLSVSVLVAPKNRNAP